ncbi:PREDICTED: epithelial cell adhesion molecule [Nanorana parkeri]|uniref:epithelial cell adhesion molecule n=1 Tax=Nanorana parkeri TaxID=125878 RepID=UPI000854EBEF|nr:PREDICTED: epithelial cell adhesion molecule [Nanorana parkeri]
MKTSTILSLAAVLIGLVVIEQARSQNCKCKTLALGKCDAADGNAQDCKCVLQIGTDERPVNCTKLIPKCWLMKRESVGTKAGRRPRPQNALVDNDGLYNPDCEANGAFKARQCNNTDTCWCVNSAGVRRTDKGDKNKKCAELVRTFWVIVEMKREDTDNTQNGAIETALRSLITNRYNLPPKYIEKFVENSIFVDLKQNSSVKVLDDVDIADVGYYLEKDIKGDPIMHADEKFEFLVNGKNFVVKEPLILYVDEKPHEISMKHLTPGVIAVIVVVIVAIIAGIVVLVLTRRKRGRYEKAEMKEMNEMQKELNS